MRKKLLFLVLSENPYSDAKKVIEISKLESSKELALKAVHESIVLLKNENNLLPLAKDKYKITAIAIASLIVPEISDILANYLRQSY
jgi:beta-glucosidase